MAEFEGEPTEIVQFIGDDEDCTHLIKENYTKVNSSEGSHNKGSSKLTLKNFVDFNWEPRYYRGQLITLHISEKFIAYGFSKPETSEGLVRIVKLENNERTLIKGFAKGLIEDISFAHLYEILMLACIDAAGTIYVYIIKEELFGTHKLKIIPIFQINGDPSYCYQNKYLLSWCQYISEQVTHLKELEFQPTYKGKILAVVRCSEVEVWHIGIASSFTAGPVCANFNLNKSLDTNLLTNIKNSVIKINLKESEITNVSFSPDGSTISIALCNGSIFFYEISFEQYEESLKLRFAWHPEEVFLSLRSIVFLDNRKHIDGDVELWKYAVTLTNHNEVHLWSCITWKPLQKLIFNRPFLNTKPMKLSIDGTGKYIFLSDIENNLLYVMEVYVDTSSKKNPKIVSITEILLQSPILNMIIVDAKVDSHNLLDHCIDDSSNNLFKYTTKINLFAIQPKSIQEGQLIVLSPEITTNEQGVDNTKIEPINIFPNPPNLDVILDSVDLSKERPKEFQTSDEPNTNLPPLSSMEVHKMVKEQLRLKSLGRNKIAANTMKDSSIMKNNYNNVPKVAVQQPNNFPYPQDTYDLNEARECSPNNSEVQKIFKQELEYSYQPIEAHKDNFESSVYSTEIEKEETNCYPNDSVSGFSVQTNGSTISTIRQPDDESEIINHTFVNQMDDIYTCLQDINTQLKVLSKKQKTNDNQITMNTTSLCQNLEPVLTSIVEGIVKNASDQTQRKFQTIEHQLVALQKKVADIAKNSNSNKIDTEVFTRSLVASLSPTLDAILKDLFLSTVIPKFEHACVSMFKQIDASFTERSLEYQNELKLLLNEEGNINAKLEYAFDKFKNDMSNIIKHSENNVLSAQNAMQTQFSYLLKETLLPAEELFVKESDNITNQFIKLDEILARGDEAAAFEIALSASNLELVLYLCDKVLPEDLFLQPNLLKTPIVLSLIQQLSHDLNSNTELKFKYLEAAVGSLDYTNEHYKDNINLVLTKMNSNVEKFMSQNYSTPYFRKFKMLQLAVKTIIGYNNY